MFRGLIFAIIICFVPLAHISANAGSIPDEVMKPYKASLAALQDNDFESALKHSKEAWQLAESLLGDSKTTGDLAQNYGLMAMRTSDLNSAAKALERSTDLAHLVEKNGELIRLEREVNLITVLLAIKKKDKAHQRIDDALEFAEANNVNDTVFAGEIMVHKARLIAGSANSSAKKLKSPRVSRLIRSGKKSSANRMQWRSAQYATTAVGIFEKNPKLARAEYSAIAYKLIGFSHERDKEWLEATLAYQKTMVIQGEYLQREEAASITTIGRWTNARMHLLADMDKEEAYKKGLCKCWPYSHASSEVKYIAKPIKRVPPKMPSRATTSGFSFMKFDIDDDGKPINIEIMHSWPEKMYNRSSIAAVKRWRYTPRVPEESDEQRKNIRADMRYILTDYYGRAPI